MPCDRCDSVVSCVQVGNPGLTEQVRPTPSLHLSQQRSNNLLVLKVGQSAPRKFPRVQEQRANFGLWAILKSPLVIGTDLRKLSKASLKILTAEEVIAVNQDKLGVAGDLVAKEGPEEVDLFSCMDGTLPYSCRLLDTSMTL